MKLLTEMQDGCVHSGGCCIDTEAASPLTVARLEHDAACAHALMQAMDKMAWPAHRETLIERASEIMAGWGFDSGRWSDGMVAD